MHVYVCVCVCLTYTMICMMRVRDSVGTPEDVLVLLQLGGANRAIRGEQHR
jgi:hypothetical protein